MFSETDIRAKAWLTVEVCNSMLSPLKAEKVFLIGSYANGTASEESDVDFIVQLKPPLNFRQAPVFIAWSKLVELNEKLSSEKIHVTIGTEEATKSLHEKHKHEVKNYAYREIKIGDNNATTLPS